MFLQIVIPIEYDQFFWAEKAKELGVSPDMVLAPSISVKLMQSAVVRLHDQIVLSLLLLHSFTSLG